MSFLLTQVVQGVFFVHTGSLLGLYRVSFKLIHDVFLPHTGRLLILYRVSFKLIQGVFS